MPIVKYLMYLPNYLSRSNEKRQGLGGLPRVAYLAFYNPVK